MRTIKLILFAVLLASAALAQTTAGLMPEPKIQFFDNNGNPLAGGKVWTYAAGTTNLLASYTDSTGNTPNANPVILDAGGRASIWLGASAYKIVLQDSTGASVWTVDNVTAPTASSSSITISSGATLTLASGSTTSISTDLLSAGNGLYNLGSLALPWKMIYANGITLGTTGLMPTANFLVDLGAYANAFAHLYSQIVYAANLQSCATDNSSHFTLGCFSFVTTNDATNNFMTLSAGGTVFKWSKEESGTPTNNAVSYLHLIPDTDNLRNLGSASFRWANGYFSGTVSGSLSVPASGSITLNSTATITPPSGSVLNGAIACPGGQHFASITFSQGLATGYTCN